MAPDWAILVVDDDAAKRLALRVMLAPLGHPVVEADSGRAALRAVTNQRFAVILMDVRMPTLDGLETAKLIRQRPESARTPIIFVTGFERDEVQTAAAYAGGAVDFIFAPILAHVLHAKVSAFVDLFVQAEKLRRSLESVSALNAALRESEERARAVLLNVADGIVTSGEDGRIESINRSARRMFDYREEELVGEPLSRSSRTPSRASPPRRWACARTARPFRWSSRRERDCASASGRSRSVASVTSPPASWPRRRRPTSRRS